MSTRSDAYELCRETIVYNVKTVVVNSCHLLTQEQIADKIRWSLHDFVHHNYMHGSLTEPEADELHSLADKVEIHV